MTAQEPIASATEPKEWRCTVSDFLLLDGNGSFAKSARAELLDGEIWVLNAVHSRHAAIQAELQGRIWQALSDVVSDLRSYVAPSVEMDAQSLPEPDLVIARQHGEGFLPVSKVYIAIEVSDTTLAIDMGRKVGVYATAKTLEYWVVDTNAQLITQMWAPVDKAYTNRCAIAFGGQLTAATISGFAIKTDRL